jgi:group I intron endonuclease
VIKVLGGTSMKEIISGIYEIKNTANGKNYIGSAINIYKRWGSHVDELRRKNHKNKHLQRAWDRYGEENFCFNIMETCDPDLLITREQYYIDTINPTYNMARIAGSTLGKKHSDDAINKMRLAKLGKKVSEETKKKMSQAGLGRIFSDEHRLNLSKSSKGNKNFLGRTHTPETRKKLSDINKGKPKSEEHKRKLSKARIGIAPWNKGKIGLQVSPNKGKHMSDETKRKLSESQKERLRKRRHKI